jgi:mannose-6-phosphate isomerase-like protein (cupin superfamily)
MRGTEMIDGLVINKPWGFEFSVFKRGVSVHILHINKGEETSFHCHMHKDVLMVLLSGRARMNRSGSVNDYLEDVELQPMYIRQIAKGIFHKTIAIEDAVIMEIESGDDVHDLIRGEDKYKRPQGYEVKDIVAVDDIVRSL